MDLIEELINDHRQIKKQFDPFRRSCILKYDGQLSSTVFHIKALTQEFRNMILLDHFRKEEEQLFPELEEIGVSVEHGPIGMLLLEHKTIREYIRNLETFIIKIETENPVFLDLFCYQLKDLIKLFELHADKEEKVLFEVAKHHLYAN